MAAWCTKHARGVVFAWCVAVAVIVLAGLLAGAHDRSDFRLPGTDSQAANDLIQRDFPAQRGDSELVVVSTPTGSLLAGTARANAEELFGKLRAIPGVRSVSDPLAGTPGAAITLDRRTAIAVLNFEQPSISVPVSAANQLIDQVTASRSATFNAAVTGWVIEDTEATAPPIAEIVGLIAATLVLLWSLGSLAAVAVALGNAFVALGVSFGLLNLLSHALKVPFFAPQVALTVGLGIGIDYALLTIARYRGARQFAPVGAPITIAALRRSGHTVAFAGGTVILATVGLLIVPVTLVQGLTAAVAVAVIPTILASTTLLPALLRLCDAHLDRGRPRLLRRHVVVERSAAWGRWAAAIQRRPVMSLVLSLGLLGLLAAPMLWLRLAPADGSLDAPGSMTSQAYQLTTRAFGPGVTSPLDVVATLPTSARSDDPNVAKVNAALARTPDVEYVVPAVMSPTGRAAFFRVIPASAPDSPTTATLLRQVRTTVAADLGRSGIEIRVGGQAALQADLATRIHQAFPRTALAVIGGSFLLLLLQFRSLLIAVKAGLMNLLSIAAAFGVVVAIFQWGWGIHLLGAGNAGPVQSFVPLLLFPVLFGLSMDYEVFLMSRITDEWHRTGDARTAVTEGLATTGRVVTSGAAIMFALFTAMVLGGNRTVDMFGIGLATAVLLDATVIRSVMLPATMTLLGRLNWWIPRWLDRMLPELRRLIETDDAEPAADAPRDRDPDRAGTHDIHRGSPARLGGVSSGSPGGHRDRIPTRAV